MSNTTNTNSNAHPNINTHSNSNAHPNINTYSNLNTTTFKYPTLGSICKSKIIRSCFTNYTISIFEIEGTKSRIEYKGTIKIDNYECKHQYGDVVECVVVGYSDTGINCILKEVN